MEFFALLKLDEERINEDVQNYSNSVDSLPEISEYFEKELDIKAILQDAGINHLPHIISWEMDSGTMISPISQYGIQPSYNEGHFVFARVKDNQIDLCRVETKENFNGNGEEEGEGESSEEISLEIKVLKIDESNEDLYMQVGNDLYRVSYNSLFE